MIRLGIAFFASWAALMACTRMSSERENASGPSSEPTSASPAPVVEEARPPVRPWARVTRSRGDATVPAAGTVLESEAHLALPEDSELVIDFAEGERLELFGPARAILLREPSNVVLLGLGEARVLVLPSSRPPREAFRIATGSVTVELGRSGDVFVSSNAEGSSYVGTLAGAVELFTGAVNAEGRLAGEIVPAGRAAHTSLSGPSTSLRGAARIDEVRGLARAVVAKRKSKGLERALVDARDAVEATLVALEAEVGRGVSLVEEQKRAVAAGGSTSGELRTSLVRHSQMLLLHRALLRVHWERLCARALLLASEEEHPEVRARRERVASALGESAP